MAVLVGSHLKGCPSLSKCISWGGFGLTMPASPCDVGAQMSLTKQAHVQQQMTVGTRQS